MEVYTYSEARQRLAEVLDLAARDGAVRIRRRDGQLFELRPKQPTASPLDVDGVKLNVQGPSIVTAVRGSDGGRG